MYVNRYVESRMEEHIQKINTQKWKYIRGRGIGLEIKDILIKIY